MKKQHIVTAAIILLFAGLGYWKFLSGNHPDTVKEQSEQTQTKEQYSSGVPASSGETSNIELKRPSVPVGGTMYGLIEVGASGFNAFAVMVDKDDNWEVAKKIFGKSLAKEGFATAADIRAGLKEKVSELSEQGVSGRNIHFIVSSGALQDGKIQQIMNELEKSYTVQRVTADAEGKYGLRAALPPAYRDNAYVVDMGSGNTKISWFEGTKLRTIELPGAKYYANGLSDASVFEQVKNGAATVPPAKRGMAFIIGGIPYELSKESKPTNLSPRFVELKHPDEYSAGDNAKKKCGLNIYKAIVDGAGTEHFVFDVDANFTIGYLLAIN